MPAVRSPERAGGSGRTPVQSRDPGVVGAPGWTPPRRRRPSASTEGWPASRPLDRAAAARCHLDRTATDRQEAGLVSLDAEDHARAVVPQRLSDGRAGGRSLPVDPAAGIRARRAAR